MILKINKYVNNTEKKSQQKWIDRSITEAGKINYGGAEEGKQGTQVRDYDGSPGKKCWQLI